MKKFFKRSVSVFLCALLVLSVAPLGSVMGFDVQNPFSLIANADETDYAKEGPYTYTTADGEATILWCDEDLSGDIVIPSTLGGYPVTSIETFAFEQCSGITSLTIPATVYNISPYTLWIEGLKSITVDVNSEYYSSADGVLFNKDMTTLIKYPVGNERTSYTIPDSVEEIGYDAFAFSVNLKSIVISDSVTNIGESAFSSCSNLSSVDIPNSVSSIEGYAFAWCDSLEHVTIGNSVTSIGYSAFFSCSSLSSIEIPDCVTDIGYDIFAYCSNLRDVSIGSGVISIGYDTFFACDSLANITVDPENKNYLSIDGVLFSKDKAELIQYPIGNERTGYAIPNGVILIGGYAFAGCENLENVTIPDSAQSIQVHAFSDCSGLSSITIPAGVEGISDYAFTGCTGLTNISVDEENEYYSSLDGVLFTKEKDLLIQYPVGNTRTSYTIPDGVTSIFGAAFLSCRSLESVIIPDSVTDIGCETFSQCIALTEITLPNNLTYIPFGTFSGCTGLTSIDIPDSVTHIGSEAFSQCTSLTSIDIPDSVIVIDSYAFSSCTNLESVLVGSGVTSIYQGAFFECNSLTDVYYNGTDKDWDKIEIYEENNDPLLYAEIHYTGTEKKGIFNVILSIVTAPVKLIVGLFKLILGLFK